MKTKLFRDPVHDIIAFDLDDPVDRVLFHLICTRTFQRLRRVRQLGFANLIYHGAEHSRFAHSLGVCHIARRMVSSLGLAANEDDRMEVLCAALLHDVGHGPFSHAIEKVTHVHHESYSAQLIADPGGDLFRVLSSVDATLPARVASYFGPREAFPRHKHVLRDIVSSQLDADRQDYILRDGHATGVKIGMYDFERILSLLTTYHGESSGVPTTRLAVSHRAREAVEDYLLARFHMFKQVYLHKTVRAAEKMLEALLSRASYLHANGHDFAVPRDTPLLRMLAGTRLSTDEFVGIDDTDIWMMLKLWSRDQDSVLRGLSRGLLERRLYKTIDLDQSDPVMVARMLDQANNIAAKQGHDPTYAVLVDRARDTPYRPYDPSAPSASAHIPIVERDGRVVPIEDGSDFVHLLGRDSYNMLRLCVPGSVREQLEKRGEVAREVEA